MSSDEIFNMLKNDFELIAQYTDDQKDSKPSNNLKRLTDGKTSAVPLYMVLDTNGKEIARLIPPNNIASLSVEEFATFMRDAKAKFEAEFGMPKSSVPPVAEAETKEGNTNN